MCTKACNSKSSQTQNPIRDIAFTSARSQRIFLGACRRQYAIAHTLLFKAHATRPRFCTRVCWNMLFVLLKSQGPLRHEIVCAPFSLCACPPFLKKGGKNQRLASITALGNDASRQRKSFSRSAMVVSRSFFFPFFSTRSFWAVFSSARPPNTCAPTGSRTTCPWNCT